jgi:tetratricopeptide (TPR) repeat protein
MSVAMAGMDMGQDFEDLDERQLNDLGNAYSAQGMWEEAISSYLRSLALRKIQCDQRGQGIVLNNLGATYYRQGRPEEARDCYEASRQIARELGEGLSELVTLMNLVFLDFSEQHAEDFLRRADEAEILALELARWEPLSRLSWLKGRLALSVPERFQPGLVHYAAALDYASREGESELWTMLGRVDAQAEQLVTDGARGLALVMYDYLHVFAQDRGFGEGVLLHLTTKREQILRRPSLA